MPDVTLSPRAQNKQATGHEVEGEQDACANDTVQRIERNAGRDQYAHGAASERPVPESTSRINL